MKDLQHYINESEMLGLDEYVYINEAWAQISIMRLS